MISLPEPDGNGIVRLLNNELSAENHQRKKTFGRSAWVYDLAQKYWVRPRLHKADHRRHRAVLSGMLQPFLKSQVLDVACGTGAAMAYLDQSSHYTGLDLSYPMLQRAWKRAQKKKFAATRFIHGNAERLSLSAESFDLVVMDTALHMIPGYEKALSEIARVLKREGVFVCSVPVTGIDATFDAEWQGIAQQRGLHSLTVAGLESLCAANRLAFSRTADNGGVLYFQARKTDRVGSTPK